MDTQNLRELVDLGAATAETQGFPTPENDIVGVGLLAAGLSDED
ncbi:benenodin family lasso peptide [Stakelama sp. CBK3Z-3]|uniref:Benenodin family lasso peptide n=1 Tax=Stakelama flava TaxID=2860338 RepID=A0ABS6XPT5_9SPHN|nr:benenodin family lasso peptide [Stakelama flava]MBW4332232.1 benenodin family lasso peptide [Stakelama flava]